MSRQAILWSIVFALMGLVLWFYFNRPSIYSATTQRSVASEHANSSSKSNDKQSGVVKSEIQTADSERVLQVSDLKSLDTRLIALSRDEARWLDRHHFPTVSELASLQARTYSDLENERNFNDPKMATLLGIKLADDGDYQQAAAVLNKAARQGSIYAREEAAIVDNRHLAERLGGSADNDNNKAIVLAKLEVAKILGDHRVDILIEKLSTDFDQRAYGPMVQQYVTEFMRQLGADHQVTGRKAPGPDPRPNADLWAEIDNLPADSPRLITIHERSR